MRELDEYREKLLKRLSDAVMEFCSACLAAAEPFAPIDGGWNVHQIAVHTRDTDRLVYGVRARRTLSEQNPRFENFNGDAYMTAHYDPGEPLADVLEGLAASMYGLVALTRAAAGELGPHGIFVHALGRGIAQFRDAEPSVPADLNGAVLYLCRSNRNGQVVNLEAE